MEKAIEWIYLETHFDEPRSMVIRKTLEFKILDFKDYIRKKKDLIKHDVIIKQMILQP